MQASTNQSEFESSVDYGRLLSEVSSRDLEVLICHLSTNLNLIPALTHDNAPERLRSRN
jgi:hypothetical protein